jgi:hypothetical protein
MYAHNASPLPEWYEPADLIDEDEPAPDAAEMLVVAHGIVWWTAA